MAQSHPRMKYPGLVFWLALCQATTNPRRLRKRCAPTLLFWPPDFGAKTGVPNERVGTFRSMLMSLTPGSPLGGNRNLGNVESVAHDIAMNQAMTLRNSRHALFRLKSARSRPANPTTGGSYYQWIPACLVKDTPLAAPTPAATGIVVPGI